MCEATGEPASDIGLYPLAPCNSTGQLKHATRDMNSFGQLPRYFLHTFLQFLVAQVVLRAQ